MGVVLDAILNWFSGVYSVMNQTVFTAWGFHVSYFWLLLGLTFLGFLFTVLLPFASKAHNSALSSKSRSERNTKGKGK